MRNEGALRNSGAVEGVADVFETSFIDSVGKVTPTNRTSTGGHTARLWIWDVPAPHRCMTVEGVADADTTRDGGAVNPTEEIVRDGGAVEGVTQMIINVYLHLYNYKIVRQVSNVKKL